MKTVTQAEIKTDLLHILEMVRRGEDILIKSGQTQENIAVIISYTTYQKRQTRPLGILKDKAKCTIRDDFAVTDEELVAL